MAGKFPIVHEFGLMLGCPFNDEPEGTGFEVALEDGEVFNRNQGFLLTIANMKMGRRMVVVIHGDDDAKEAANFWHYVTSSTTFSAFLTLISPDSGFGSRASRIDARVLDCSSFLLRKRSAE